MTTTTPITPATPRPPVMIGSWNALPALARASQELAANTPLLDAVVRGISLVEDDPDEMSVGFGGLPNEDCVVELDAAVMDGLTHRSGAVAGLRSVRHAARLALEVMRRTDHALLVGDGALKFARLLGFPEENLLTDRARKAWLNWKANLSDRDAWVTPDQAASSFGTARWAGRAGPEMLAPDAPPPKVPFTYGTIHVSALDAAGNLASCTSTSGLSYKIAGRVGDSPVVGAGLYTDNAVGSAGATGRGESVLQVCGAHTIVARMEAGDSPTDACLVTLKKIADRTRLPHLRDDQGRPTFNVTLYALRKDGLFGAASMHEGYEFAVLEHGMPRAQAAAFLFPRSRDA
ncbi:MAG: N(4)-(beta-N-acetylglucosaminyl)-L-asparaginase [Phycisphaerae bacterium]|nr:N(4)-(beta-N-acetylglucosaminyl)-L-asparaginase [Phycisphaerae bacterium]